MNQNLKLKCMAGVALLLASSSCMAANDVRRLNCQADFSGIKHRLTIETEGEKIISFEYVSFTPDAHSCDFGAKRLEVVVVKGDKSEWRDTSEKTFVDMNALGQPLGKVMIEKKEGTYELRIVEQALNACGIRGYIVPHVRLRPGKNTCEFPSGPQGQDRSPRSSD
jgi:hypothetical protein